MSQKKLTKQQLRKKWEYHRKMEQKYSDLLGKLETHEEAIEREISTWPEWKRNIHICGSQIRVGNRTICQCKNPKEYNEIREQQRRDYGRYSYWPE